MIAIMSLPPSALSRFSWREQHLGAGEILFRAGDPVRSLFLVAAGRVRLTRTSPRGSELTLQRASPGAVLAEASLFADRYHCEAVADEPSLLRAASASEIRAALREDAALAAAWAEHLAIEVQRARAQAEMLSLKTVAERVDAWITLNDGTLPQKGRWRRIASEIGVSPEALYRELARRR